MKSKQLIEENNRKREQLSPQNDKYYSDMLIYIRLQLSLSEQQSEEVLMEMLDHLLDGQHEGKSAQDIFGDDPKRYADEIILNLPKEQKREVIPFILRIVIDLVSWMLMIRGVVILVISQFNIGNVSTSVYLFPTLFIFAFILGSITFGVWYIFRIIKQSLFKEKANEKKNIVKAGTFRSGIHGTHHCSKQIYTRVRSRLPLFLVGISTNRWDPLGNRIYAEKIRYWV